MFRKKLQLRAKFHMIAAMTHPALDFVIAALEKIRESNDRLPRVSMRALAQLQAEHPVRASLRETRTPLTERRLHPSLDKAQLLEPIRQRVCACTKCAHLACSRTQTVFGVGNPTRI